MGVPVRCPAGAGARPWQTAMTIRAAVTASTRATLTETGAANRRLLELQAPWISDNRPAANAETDIREEH